MLFCAAQCLSESENLSTKKVNEVISSLDNSVVNTYLCTRKLEMKNISN